MRCLSSPLHSRSNKRVFGRSPSQAIGSSVPESDVLRQSQGLIARRRLHVMKAKPLDFLVIGAHKSGTTTLFQYLRHHPELFLPPEKEAGFFSNDYWWGRGWDAFADEFFVRASKKALWGKVTPQYMAYRETPVRIRALMPNVKLIAILRNPIDRAYSHYRMAARTLAEKRTFHQAVAVLQQDEDDPTGYFAMGQYGRILFSYLTHFPAAQLLILFSEDLQNRPQFVMDSIARFLGVNSGFTPRNLGINYHVGGMRQRFPALIPTVKSMYPVWWFWRRLPERRRRVIRFWFQTEAAPSSSDR